MAEHVCVVVAFSNLRLEKVLGLQNEPAIGQSARELSLYVWLGKLESFWKVLDDEPQVGISRAGKILKGIDRL